MPLAAGKFFRQSCGTMQLHLVVLAPITTNLLFLEAAASEATPWTFHGA